MRLAQIANGIVVNVIEVDPAAIPDFAIGWPEVALAGPGWGFNGEAFSEPALPAPTGDDVNVERQRRLNAGSSFAVAGIPSPIPLTGTTFDMSVYLGRMIEANAMKAAGVTDPVLIIRDGQNVIQYLTPDQMIDLIAQAMQFVQAVMVVSWAMKDATGAFTAGIPADYTDDGYWP